MDGAADVAETAYTRFRSKPDAAPVRLIVRRVKPTPGSQLALFARYSYHGFITDRDGDTLELEGLVSPAAGCLHPVLPRGRGAALRAVRKAGLEGGFFALFARSVPVRRGAWEALGAVIFRRAAKNGPV